MSTKTIGGQEIKRYFLRSKFNPATAMDFLNYIIVGSKSDRKALATWEKHFQGLKIPYAITKETFSFGDVIKLWKRKEV
jgi:hypothetical protein